MSLGPLKHRLGAAIGLASHTGSAENVQLPV